MKTCAMILSAIGLMWGLNSCQSMPTAERKGTAQFTNPSKHHPYPVRAKNRANQKH